MNLTKLFDAQKKLRERINYNGEDRFEKLILALLVEIGECANEQRTWKFWSTDREPRTEKLIECDDCKGSGRDYSGYCGNCHGGYVGKRNPLLEEYVDGLHFVLDLWIDIDVDLDDWVIDKIIKNDITTQFISINQSVTDLWDSSSESQIVIVLEYYLGLGEMLGFTDKQIEQAYYDKNQINHERQNNGY